MKVYITKHWLTSGIIECETNDIDGEICKVKDNERPSFSTYYHGKEWHKTMEDAKLDANSRRIRKIASLKKQLAKLEEMKF